ncbi:hypothetical protein [Tautonia plasticadhaerens]|uniref:Uncharacterized protein n=1 Tax=Tautonia plasticadhaerens TaxID=2527974 RepID=A0A518HAH8_9BACT|nr:hypothetical protein [Tautonia plasticadhaerens]QDV37858.1 hypothetical protein ElP_58050 [Tautonia plasticadhaerens]
MIRPRVSIAALMVGVLLIAGGFAALNYPSILGANALGTLLQGSLLVSILGAVLGRGSRRAFWSGFAISGVAYTLMVFDLAPRPSPTRPLLVTGDLLILLKEVMHDDPNTWDNHLEWMTTTQRTDWTLFYQTGQSLIALMVGMLGGLLGRGFAGADPEPAAPRLRREG